MEPSNTKPAAALSRPNGKPIRPLQGTVLLTAGYTLTAIAWLLLSGWLLWDAVVDDARATRLVITNVTLFVIFTTAVLAFVIHSYLMRLADSEAQFAQAQAELRRKDLAVRQGYVDVLDAVTGGKLILITEDELEHMMGEVVLPSRELPDAKAISGARKAIAETIGRLRVHDAESAVLAAGEALTNAIKHGGRGEYSVYRTRACVQIVVRDFGPGIDFRELPKATLVQGFSTANTMGLGFTIMLDVSDRVLLTTDTRGTVVVLEIESEPVAMQQERSLASILASALALSRVPAS